MSRFKALTRYAIALAAVVALASLAPVFAKDDPKSEIGILLGAGFGDESLVGKDRTDKPGLLVGIRGGYFFHPQLQWFVDGTMTFLDSDLTGGKSLEEHAARTGIEWVAMPQSNWRPFLNLGVGIAHDMPNGLDSFNRSFGSVGLGVRGLVSDRVIVRFEARADQDFTDGGPAPFNGENFLNYKGMFGLIWGLGPLKDDDADGVSNRKDKCPGTPAGAVVDKDGCPIDSDGDTVYDGLDKCPNTPKGYPVDATGCPRDTDGDGVVDGLDKCPNTPKGCKVDASGCPIDTDGDGICDGLDQCAGTVRGCKVDAKGCTLDGDGDGVCDGVDQCLNTPKGDKVDPKGCTIAPPAPAPVFTPEQRELILEGVTFEYNSDKITPEATFVLDKVAYALDYYKDVKIEIDGHTDNKGGKAYNQKLSEARAKSVMEYFTGKGISPSRMSAKGYGMTQPIADNKTDEGRAKNRRVALKKVE